MSTTIGFNLEQRLNEFESRVLSSPEVTPRDSQDLKVHLLDCFDQYKAKGLDDEEAFLLALNQMGNTDAWEDGFKEANRAIVQVKRALGFMGGVFIYFLLYSLILVFSKTLLYTGGRLHIETGALYQFNKYFLQVVYLLTVLGIIALAMREQWFLRIISKINLPPKKIILLFVLIVFLAIADRIIEMLVKGVLKYDMRNYVAIEHTFVWFEYLFPLIFAGGFLIIYIRYFKETKKETE